MSDSGITLEGVTKRFGSVVAVRSVSLEIEEGEFFSLLGPSGCGKTTTLRMIGGFEQPDEGRILLRGVDVTAVPPNRRNVNMVFQHYALFPHMSIGDNIAFGMRLKRVDKAERRERVAEMLRIVRLERLEKRKPAQLSGGQQQRVALARALVNRPAALLLDEPLGALDVKLRKQMQLELKRIQSELGTTFVYVTHDQEEALAMSDRIAVMNDGVVEQVAPPRELYERPVTAFCADFIGSLNALDFRVDEVADGRLVSRVSPTERLVVEAANGHSPGDSLKLAVRPERVRIDLSGRPAPDEGSRLEGVVAEVIYLGSLTQFYVDTKVGRVVSYRMNDEERGGGIDSGRDVVLTWPLHGSSVLAGPLASD
ncbi:MAG TPA: ABC transporter ATP-binding protein [Gaiellaceae bacterium]|nr:ABC transporter ATP-binding protein [Gaiellaceae bacterium]